MFEKTPIVVLAAPRTGTHLLRSSMHGNPEILDIGEFLNPQQSDNGEFNFFRRMKNFHKNHMPESLLISKVRQKSFAEYFAGLQENYPGRRFVFDLKYNHVQNVDISFRYPDVPPLIVQALASRGAAFIHLTRRNLLRQFCSQQIARETSIWVNWKRDTVAEDEPQQIKIDTGKLIGDLEDISFRSAIVDKWLRSVQRKLPLAYEDLLKDGCFAGDIANKIIALTGEDWTIPGKPGTRKQGHPLRITIKNYAAVRSTLMGTPFAQMLEPEPKSVPAQPDLQPCPDRPRQYAEIGRAVLVISDKDGARKNLNDAIGGLQGFTSFGGVFDDDADTLEKLNFSTFLSKQILEFSPFRQTSDLAETILERYFQFLSVNADKGNICIHLHPDSLRLLDWPPHPVAAPPTLVSFIRSRKIPVILLIQRDRIADAAERMLCEAETGNRNPGPVELDPAAFARSWHSIAASHHALQLWFRNHHTFAELVLEDLLSCDQRLADNMANLARTTGLPVNHLIPRMSTEARPIESRIANYGELRETIAKTSIIGGLGPA